jgi:hypothetical protein
MKGLQIERYMRKKPRKKQMTSLIIQLHFWYGIQQKLKTASLLPLNFLGKPSNFLIKALITRRAKASSASLNCSLQW